MSKILSTLISLNENFLISAYVSILSLHRGIYYVKKLCGGWNDRWEKMKMLGKNKGKEIAWKGEIGLKNASSKGTIEIYTPVFTFTGIWPTLNTSPTTKEKHRTFFNEKMFFYCNGNHIISRARRGDFFFIKEGGI